MNRSRRKLASMAAMMGVSSLAAWTAVEAVCDSVRMHRPILDGVALAVLGAPGRGDYALADFWLLVYGPACLAATALLWNKGRRWLPAVLAILGFALAPAQWSIANRSYGAGDPNCLSDIAGFPQTCGLPLPYQWSFAVAGVVAGMLIGWLVVRLDTGSPEALTSREVAEVER